MFLTTASKASNNTAKETDASGLLSIIINGEFFQSELQCTIDPPNDIFSQVREIKNEILHNSELDLTDQDVTRYLQSMITVLEDKKVLYNDPSAQAAAIKLQEILNDELVITSSEEANALDALKEAKESIRKLAEESEKKFRKVTEDNQNSLRQQMLAHTTEILYAREQAKRDVTSTVSTVFEETYEPEIKEIQLGHEDHECRLKAVEAEQTGAKLKSVEEKYQEQKQDLQQHLVEKYQNHYVKTWICPISTQQNDVNISDVYASPRLVVEEKEDCNVRNSTKQGKDNETDEKLIERYNDLFGADEKRNRKIFIVGDVGTGKSSFCKMLMQNWCSSITNRSKTSESDAIDEDEVIQEEEYNRCDMNRCDFLFYIPLCEMPDFNDAVDMIKAQLSGYESLVDDIFENKSECILILEDGLDEWTPTKSNRQSLHGIPTSRFARYSTIITTSRPSSRGILNLKSSEFDLKVTLLGLKKSSVNYMVEKYMKQLHKTSAVAQFYNTLSNLPFKDIEKAPMLLQQIIWLYCNDYSIGQAKSSIYVHIINAVFGWGHEKRGVNPSMQSSHLVKLPLPIMFDKYARYQENRELLLLIGKIAYHAYIQKTDSVSSLVFGRNKLKQIGLSTDDISTILQTGILTEVNCTDPTYEKSQISFIHTSYVEFFATLYVCSTYLWKVCQASFCATPLTVLEDLLAVTRDTSVTDILRFENVLVMICGLVPSLTEHVCDFVYKLTPSGDNIDTRKVRQIQNLTFACLLEHNSVDQEDKVNFKLRHLYLPVNFKSTWVKIRSGSLEPTSIETCKLCSIQLSHEQCSFLSSLLSHAVSLKVLDIRYMHCTKDNCEGHIIDLSNQKDIENIKFLKSKISVPVINPSSLQVFEISHCELSRKYFLLLFLSQAVSLKTLVIECIKFTEGISHLKFSSLQVCVISDCELTHTLCSLLLSTLSQAVSLQILEIRLMKCIKNTCDGHIVNLSNHRTIERIKLTESNIIVSGINPSSLRFCEISHCKFSHKHCSLLLSSLSQAVSLQTLEIPYMVCNEHDCTGHIIDLSSQSKIESIKLWNNNISVLGLSPGGLQVFEIGHCKLSHKQYSLLSSFLSKAVSLQNLEITYMKCTEDNCKGHIIDLSNQRKLKSIKLSSNKISVSVSGTNPSSLQLCKILCCKLSHKQASLLSTFLSQAFSLETLEITDMKCTEDNCKGHTIDVSNQRKLKSITLGNSEISGTNPSSLQFLKISHCKLSNKQCSLLSSFLSQAVSLETLQIVGTKCTEDNCETHIIDLSNQMKLKIIKLLDSEISVAGTNPSSLQLFNISNCKLSHKQCSLLSSFLSQAVSLETLEITGSNCTEDNCGSHIIDLSNQMKLKRINIWDSEISVSGTNPSSLQEFKLSDCKLSHTQCSLLSAFLSQAVSLKMLEISGSKCTEDTCESHIIDLSNQMKLKRIGIWDSEISVSGTNPSSLQEFELSDCKLSHKQCSLLSAFLSQAVSLKMLEITGSKCNEDNCESHIIDLSNQRKLESIEIWDSEISVSGLNSRSLLFCKISDCRLSNKQCSLL